MLSTGNRVRIYLGTAELPHSAGTRLVEVVDDGHREVKHDVEG